MTLYVKCCPRENSRTDKLARALLTGLGEYEVVDVCKENLQPVNDEDIKRRESLGAAGNFSYPMFHYAKQFAFADNIVIAAPYWDYSFPAALKIYIENVCVQGLTSEYDELGNTVGLCRAKKLYYVTTAGGAYDQRFSFDFIDTLSKNYFGIEDTELIYVDMLDIIGSESESIVEQKCKEIIDTYSKQA